MHQPSSVAASGLGADAGLSDIHQTIEYIMEENDGGEGCSLNEYIVEENDGGEGCSLDGMRLYCKRKSPKDEQLGARSACFKGSSSHVSAFKYCSKWTWGCRAKQYPSNHTCGREAKHSQRHICLRREPKDEQLGLLFKPTGSCIDQNPLANDPSNSSSLVISSEIAEYIVEENDGGEEYIVEENDGGEGCSLDGKRLYCKRRALEDEQLAAGLVLTLETAPVMHQFSSVATSGLGASAGPSNIHQTIGVAGEAQHSQRNIRLRRVPEYEQLEAAPVMHQPSSVVASGLGGGVGPSNIHQTIRVAGEAQHSQRNICLRRAPKDEQLGLLFKPTGSCIDQNPLANDPFNSSSLLISSGIAEYIVEENDDGEGCSLDGMRLYCKRRAPEDEQLGAGLVLALETAPVMHQSSSVAASGLGAGARPSNIH
ncbi:hypothetical protein GH714_014896 [Hevea brasiliensis]|uniref:Uncharacterized protein n=1 Tax=Hevea brasiliensis TaxID=3981 RepID=A0A6A6KR04_HEVBR|nr:hypothetical protein GH714_014896 [Hevea brasiliensis]